MKIFPLSLKILFLLGLIFTSLNSYAKLMYHQLSKEPRALKGQEEAIVTKAVQDFLHIENKEQLDSMQFIFPDYNGNKDGRYCGLVNIKDSLGHYIGYKPFVLLFKLNEQNKLYASIGGAIEPENNFPSTTILYINACKDEDGVGYDLQPLLNKVNQRYINLVSKAQEPLTEQEKKVAIQAVKNSSHTLDKKQLDSMQFVFPDYNGNTQGGYCGLVNTKNSQGKYIGYKPFILWFTLNDKQELYTNAAKTMSPDDPPVAIEYYLSICEHNEGLVYDLRTLIDQKNNNHVN